MIATSKHIVKQQILDLSVPNLEDEAEVSTVFSEVYKQHIEAIIDEICEELIPENQVVRIDSLTVDLGSIEFNKVATDFPRAIKHAIKEKLYLQIRDQKVTTWTSGGGGKHAGEDPPVTLLSTFSLEVESTKARYDPQSIRESDENVLLHYFKTGIIPWYYQGGLPELKSAFSNQLALAVRIFSNQLPGGNVPAKQRAIYFFEAEVLEALLQESYFKGQNEVIIEFNAFRSLLLKLSVSSLSLVSNNAKSLVDALTSKHELFTQSLESLVEASHSLSLMDLLDLWSQPYRQKLQLLLAHVVILEQVECTPLEKKLFESLVETFETLVNKIKTPGKTIAPSQKTATTPMVIEAMEVGDSLAINNAGLILVWPYLQAFFTGLELMHENAFTTDRMATKAVHLLHYLVFASEEGDETQWLLNKLLCGLPISYFVSDEILLSTEEKEECDNLLEVLIKNWSALKKTSPNSLRGTFLQREGLLVRNDNGWTLKIERQGFDILLDRLNWTMSVVKLPWNDYMINTEW